VNTSQGAVASVKLPGIIDTLGTGYQIVNRHPYLLALPVVLDLFYWLGPRLSVQPVAQQALQAIETAAASPALALSQAQSAQSIDLLKSSVGAMGQSLNLFSLLSSVLSIPSLLASQDLKLPSWMGAGRVVDVSTSSSLVEFAVLLFVLGVVAGAVYLGLVAQVVREGNVAPLSLAQRIPTYAWRFMQLVLVLLLIALLLIVPLAIVVTILSVIVGASAAGFIILGISFIAYVYLFFILSALFVSEARPLVAIRASITLVRRFTSPALGLILVIYIISMGIPFVWSALGSSEAATLVSIAGNAYIGTGLSVATMIFYRDRVSVASNQMAAASHQ
jgi:hypothetical protein